MAQSSEWTRNLLKGTDKLFICFRRSRDCASLTELSAENIPEIEIVSLLEESIPRYKLR